MGNRHIIKAKDISLHTVPGRRNPVIALVGSDGSGKSTVGKALFEIMQRERPTAFCHLGKQAGNLGRALRSVPFVGPRFAKKKQKEEKRCKSGRGASFPAVLVGFGFSIRRLLRFARMRRLHRQGFAILTDRYPQNDLPGPMDGPALADLPLKGHIAHTLKRLEHAFYARMVRFTPDLVIRLKVDIDTAMQRKPDHDRPRLERKISDLEHLTFNGAHILELDATQPLEQVIAQADTAVRDVFAAYPVSRPGALVALVGCDGSGKSSLSTDLVKSLSSRRPAVYHYLGLGSGDLGRRIATWPIIGPKLEKKLSHKARKTRTKGEKIPGLLTALVVFSFSMLRFRRFCKAKKSVEEGYLVITDRYPQAEIAGQCDGPGLSAARTHNPIIWLLARLEMMLYRKMASFRPDLIFFLKVDIDTAMQRKPDHNREALLAKINTLPLLTFDHAPCITLDAKQAYLAVRQEILDHMREQGIILQNTASA